MCSEWASEGNPNRNKRAVGAPEVDLRQQNPAYASMHERAFCVKYGWHRRSLTLVPTES